MKDSAERFRFRCTECGTSYAEREAELVCPRCAELQEPGGTIRGALEVVLENLPEAWPDLPLHGASFLTSFLPVQAEHLPPLPAGGSPLMRAPALGRSLGMKRLWVKDDSRNPSGSTKDRASFLVVAKALEYGYDTVAAASTGNAATALAAMCAAARLRAVVFVPESAPEAKLVQMLCYGAQVLPVRGSYDDAFELCMTACRHFGWYNRNTGLNPFTVEGKKTVALDIAYQMGEPDAVFVPTGDGAILAGVAKGFADLVRGGIVRRAPRLIAVQPEGTPAIVRALHAGHEMVTPVPGAHSVADSLVVETPRNALVCLRRIRESGGAGVLVSDDDILRSIAELARTTGIFVEPAAAAPLAGLRVALDEGLVERDERVVLLVTGTGLKDVPAAARAVDRPEALEPSLEAVQERLEASS